MAIEGSLADVGLADICQLLSLGRKTGCLTVTDRSNFGYVYFENGHVIYASILNRPDRLGDILVKNGVIQPEDLSRAMEEQGRESQKRLGEILVELESLSREDLEKWVGIQVQEAVYHLFSWNEGSFHFKPGEVPDEDQVFLVELGTDGLLLEGARRMDEWSVIEGEVHSLDLVFKLSRDPLEADGVHLTGNQEKLVPLLDGTRTVRQLIDESGLVEFETGKALYELVQGGFARCVGEESLTSEDETDVALQEHLRLGKAFYRAGMLEDASRELEAGLEIHPSEPTARFFLGLIHIRGGDPEGALTHFGAIPEMQSKGFAVLQNKALAFELLGRHDEALGTLKQAEKRSDGDAGVVLARGISELRSGDPTAARSTFARYRKKVGEGAPPPVYYAFAVLAAGADGQTEEAVSLGREGLKLYPSEPSILVNAGAVLDRSGNHEVAEQYFMRAVNSSSEVPAQAHKNLGDQALRRGDLQGAQSHYGRAIELNPALGDDVFVKLATVAAEMEDSDLAVLYYRRAIELNPDNEEAGARLADLSAAS